MDVLTEIRKRLKPEEQPLLDGVLTIVIPSFPPAMYEHVYGELYQSDRSYDLPLRKLLISMLDKLSTRKSKALLLYISSVMLNDGFKDSRYPICLSIYKHMHDILFNVKEVKTLTKERKKELYDFINSL